SVARMSAYQADPGGWQVLSLASYLSRGAIAVVLLTPMTFLMGGTLTVLVRAVVRADLHSTGWRVALLYGVNTIGAATGAVLTDFVLVPGIGIFETQLTAIALNLIAAAGAFWIARSEVPEPTALVPEALRRDAAMVATGPDEHRRKSRTRPALKATRTSPGPKSRPRPALNVTGARDAVPDLTSGRETTHETATATDGVPWAAVALALSGFAALGVEMLWLRHLAVLLG